MDVVTVSDDLWQEEGQESALITVGKLVDGCELKGEPVRCMEPRKVEVGYSLKPASLNGRAAVPCGICENCRINQERVWRNRILLESLCHGNNCFVTLTYDEKHFPDRGNVRKDHLQNYIKRLRRYVEPVKFRFFGVGEYGTRTFRPHYHIIIFGLDGFIAGNVIKKAWRKCDPDVGIDIGEVNSASAAYITGYLTKKTLKKKGKHPTNYGLNDEFILMSRRPGIGYPAVQKMVEVLRNESRIKEKREYSTIKLGSKTLILGRYLKAHMNNWQELDYTDRLLRFFASQQKYFNENHKKPKRAKYDRKELL